MFIYRNWSIKMFNLGILKRVAPKGSAWLPFIVFSQFFLVTKIPLSQRVRAMFSSGQWMSE